MTRILFIALLFFSSMALRAQADAINPGEPGFREKYSDFNFQGHFAAKIAKDATNNYFLLDFSKLPSRFERVYFMNLCFGYYKIINIDPVVTMDKVFFMANQTYETDELLKLFGDLKDKAVNTAAAWAGEEKTKWLKVNDKYK